MFHLQQRRTHSPILPRPKNGLWRKRRLQRTRRRSKTSTRGTGGGDAGRPATVADDGKSTTGKKGKDKDGPTNRTRNRHKDARTRLKLRTTNKYHTQGWRNALAVSEEMRKELARPIEGPQEKRRRARSSSTSDESEEEEEKIRRKKSKEKEINEKTNKQTKENKENEN